MERHYNIFGWFLNVCVGLEHALVRAVNIYEKTRTHYYYVVGTQATTDECDGINEKWFRYGILAARCLPDRHWQTYILLMVDKYEPDWNLQYFRSWMQRVLSSTKSLKNRFYKSKLYRKIIDFRLPKILNKWWLICVV